MSSHKTSVITALAIAAIACVFGILFCTPIGGAIALAGLAIYIGIGLIGGSVIGAALLFGIHRWQLHVFQKQIDEAYDKKMQEICEGRSNSPFFNPDSSFLDIDQESKIW